MRSADGERRGTREVVCNYRKDSLLYMSSRTTARLEELRDEPGQHSWEVENLLAVTGCCQKL
jgi:hypothetical protein